MKLRLAFNFTHSRRGPWTHLPTIPPSWVLGMIHVPTIMCVYIICGVVCDMFMLCLPVFTHSPVSMRWIFFFSLSSLSLTGLWLQMWMAMPSCLDGCWWNKGGWSVSCYLGHLDLHGKCSYPQARLYKFWTPNFSLTKHLHLREVASMN